MGKGEVRIHAIVGEPVTVGEATISWFFSCPLLFTGLSTPVPDPNEAI